MALGCGTDSQNVRQVATVVRVVDGNTVELTDGSRVRYIGIDAPGRVDAGFASECFRDEASLRNAELVEGKQVELVRDVSDKDRAGRLLRYVYVDNQMVNNVLVREGYGQVSTVPPDTKYQRLFIDAQKEAQEAALGLWAVCKGLNATPSVTSPNNGPDTTMVSRPEATVRVRVNPRPNPTPRPTSKQPSATSRQPQTSSVACGSGSPNRPSTFAPQVTTNVVGKVTVVERLQKETYLVTGCTREALSESTKATSPGHDEWTGLTRSKWSYSYRYNSTRTSCSLESMSITLTQTLTLPELSKSPGMPLDLYNGWQIFERFVKQHEEGHAEINRQIMRELQNALANVGTRSSCDALRAEMAALIKQKDLELRARQKTYEDKEAVRQAPGSVFN